MSKGRYGRIRVLKGKNCNKALPIATRLCLASGLLLMASAAVADDPLAAIFAGRGFSLSNVELPTNNNGFPADRLKNVRFDVVAKFDWFPAGPSYRPSDAREAESLSRSG